MDYFSRNLRLNYIFVQEFLGLFKLILNNNTLIPCI